MHWHYYASTYVDSAGWKARIAPCVLPSRHGKACTCYCALDECWQWAGASTCWWPCLLAKPRKTREGASCWCLMPALHCVQRSCLTLHTLAVLYEPDARGSHGAVQVREVVQEAGLKPFPDPFIEGFKYDEEGRIVYPGMQVQVRPQFCLIAQAALRRHSATQIPRLSVVLLRTNSVLSLRCCHSYAGTALMTRSSLAATARSWLCIRLLEAHLGL